MISKNPIKDIALPCFFQHARFNAKKLFRYYIRLPVNWLLNSNKLYDMWYIFQHASCDGLGMVILSIKRL